MFAQELYERITKLIKLANSSEYEGERETAKRMAAKLIAKYDLTEFNPDEIEFAQIKLSYPELTGKRIDQYIMSICDACAEHAGVALYWQDICGYSKEKKRFKKQKTEVQLAGRKVDIDHTVFLFDTLYLQYKEKLNSYTGKNKISYKKGLFFGILLLFDEITKNVLKYKEKEGLVPIGDAASRRKKAESLIGKMRLNSSGIGKINDVEAFYQGKQDAETITLSAGIPGTEETEQKAITG